MRFIFWRYLIFEPGPCGRHLTAGWINPDFDTGFVRYPRAVHAIWKKRKQHPRQGGGAQYNDLLRAYDEVLATGNKNVTIYNCPSGYPARFESINLSMIPTLKQMFGCPVAFSDHTPGCMMDIAAVALSANMIEKTITLDRTTPSVEHLFSIEPDEMKAFVTSIRNLETALGSLRRQVGPEERDRGVGGRRRIVLSFSAAGKMSGIG